ncbi:Ferric iron reductase protein FhuF, involved in iron transport [Alteribacillus persepolensis]|uniref:Ferric iron reductase protein FhuF, involved in iron transport n=1 Tax=Alteribacillus persepolensis TaxID=568899 RepID=A0A1G8C8G7_9BACI|nr:hypothetical protein [Alteribacillus persepolensis]SDH41180.1 Ferric iron reductase protein FhuF, involved in iron transport [Alteribacillus persepolensis]
MAIVFQKESKSMIYDAFSVRQHTPEAYVKKFSPKEWFHPSSLATFMKTYGSYINAPAPDMIATFWANRYSRYIAFFHWAAAKGWSTDMTFDRMNVYLCERSDRREPAFEFQVDMHPDGYMTDRQTREERLAEFYQHHVAPLIHAFSQAAGIRTRELWGQVFHAVPYFLHLAKVTETKEVQGYLQDDWYYITQMAAPSVFKEKKPPFQFKVMEIPNPVEDKPLYTKPTCCLAYKASGNCCYRCPRMKPAERQKLYEEKKK